METRQDKLECLYKIFLLLIAAISISTSISLTLQAFVYYARDQDEVAEELFIIIGYIILINVLLVSVLFCYYLGLHIADKYRDPMRLPNRKPDSPRS